MDVSKRQHAECLLLEASRALGVTAGRNEVQHALDHLAHGPSFIDWAIMHLGADNLVTTDELALYSMLDKSGEVDRLADLHDLSEVQAVTEDDVRAAIDELGCSTDAIIKQTESLTQQQDALLRLREKASQSEARRQEFETARQRRSETERKHTAAEVGDLTQSLEFRLSHLEQQAKDSGPGLNETVNNVLNSDDKLLASLQKLGCELDQQDPQESNNMERLREVCMRLIKTTVETIRTRLDRIYLEKLIEAERSNQDAQVSEEEVDALQEEMESLYAEILPVAQMSVEQEHLGPSLKSISTRSSMSLTRSVTAMNYISQCLDHLLDRNSHLRDRVETFKSHQTSSTFLIQTARAEMVPAVEPTRRTKEAANLGSPIRNPSPIRPRANRANSGARRRSSLQDESPVDTLLQALAINVPSPGEARRTARMDAVADVLTNRATKIDDICKSGQEAFEGAVVSHLEDLGRAVQLLRDSVLAESPYADVKLSDPEIDGMVAMLAQEVSQAKERLEQVESSKFQGRSQKRIEIMQRWGR